MRTAFTLAAALALATAFPPSQPRAANLTTLFSFNGSNGQSPSAVLTADANGDLFGTTDGGGANGYGTVFEIKNTGTVAAPNYAISPTSGECPCPLSSTSDPTSRSLCSRPAVLRAEGGRF